MMDTRTDNTLDPFQSDSDGIRTQNSLSRKRQHSAKPGQSSEYWVFDEESSGKKPRLTVDTSRECQPLCEALSSNESFTSSFIESDCHHGDTRQPVPSSGLSAYLEDIDSDEELDEMDGSSPSNDTSDKPHGKDGILVMMDRLDRDITVVEQQILRLEKKQDELVEGAKVPPPTSDPVAVDTREEEGGRGHHKSLMEVIYTENKQRASTAHVTGDTPTTPYLSNAPLYYQPSEAPGYWQTIQRHRKFRPLLLKYLKNKKINLYQKECQLCSEYDSLHEDWDRKVDKWERNQKKRTRDTKSRDLFERTFPELRSKSDQLRDQAHRFNRAGMRAFGVVRSEAELDELAYELFEQEEARGRHRIIHATIPSMILDSEEKHLRFINTNGLLKDPMVQYREAKSTALWSDREKAVFREKFQLFPKSFEKISTFLPNKTVSDCVRYYYLAKKAANLKSLSRRSAFKRRRQLHKSHDYPLNSSLLMDQAKTKPHPPQTTPITNKEPEWSKEEIKRLKAGLRMYGRAWGRVYREVGGNKTATQCKQFYDDYCTDPALSLNAALAEHTARKNEERVEKKMAEMKKAAAATIVESVEEEEEGSVSSGCGSSDHASSDESDSETTITDSGQEGDDEVGVSRPAPLKLNSRSSLDTEPVQSPLDIFLSAAEALSNTVPSEIALHDHTYSCPPLDIQGSSGLQLIAAAAAVVSPGLSRTSYSGVGGAGGNKVPLSHSVKAPRGRPPSTQKRNNTSSQKIGPAYLTPTNGATQSVLLQDLKPALRGRSRSAPTDKPRPQIPQKTTPIPSPLLLKGGTKIFTTPQPLKATGTPLTYTRGNQEIVSLKATPTAGNSMDTVVRNQSDHGKLVANNNVATPITVHSKGVATRTKDNSNPVLELNLALLLAAGGNNQQATLLLPPSSLFNKHTLAVLHSGGLTGDNTLTIDTPTSFTIAKHTTPTISIDLSKSDNNHTPIPLVAPIRSTPAANKQQTLTLSLATNKVKPLPSTVAPPTALSYKTVSKTPNSAPVTPLTTPTTDDLSNLNLLSNLVAGMSNKSSSNATPKATPSNSSADTPTKPIAPPTKPVTTNQWPKTTKDSKQPLGGVASTYNSAQQSLMLYTRSLPLNSAHSATPPEEEEDHLEYATRGIDELTRLLGGSDRPHPPSVKSGKGLWSPDELLCNPFTSQGGGAQCVPPATILGTVTTSDTTTGFPTTILTELAASHSTT